MGWFGELRLEWRARREGRRHLTSNIMRVTRAIGGAGTIGHRGLRVVERGGDTFVESFDRRIPPSEFVSQRDRKRSSMPIPLSERCVEDWGRDSTSD